MNVAKSWANEWI